MLERRNVWAVVSAGDVIMVKADAIYSLGSEVVVMEIR